MTAVKICGLRRPDHARAAAEAGADFLGFVFAPSRRRVEPEAVREMIDSLRPDLPSRTVGVFVDAPPDEMTRIARLCGLDYIQLSGNEPPDIVDALDLPVIRVVHVGADAPEDLERRIDEARGEIVLLDTQGAARGGTGTAFDWSLVPPLGRSVLLAGGLNADNLARAIGTVRPFGVDVSSGVETNGEKDAAKIVEFIAIARASGRTGSGGVSGRSPAREKGNKW